MEDVKEIQERDNIKRNYCKNSNIPLFEISYLDYEKLDT